MFAVDVVMYVLHVLFASLWTGSILFFVAAVLPAATSGTISAAAVSVMTTRLVWLTRIGALVFVATGGHLAGTSYTAETLFSTGRGQLVVAMLVLWFVLTGLIEISVKRFDRAAETDGVEAAVASTRPLFGIAGLLAVLLLVDAGLLTANIV